MRRTVSNLSRELRVSRPSIYRVMEKLGIPKTGGEYSLEEWERLQDELSRTAAIGKQKEVEVMAWLNAPKLGGNCGVNSVAISGVDASTLRERLENMKRDYDYNEKLIERLQEEAEAYAKLTGCMTVTSHNGNITTHPAVANIERFTRLNSALSKHISELESDLDLEVDGAGDPFG